MLWSQFFCVCPSLYRKRQDNAWKIALNIMISYPLFIGCRQFQCHILSGLNRLHLKREMGRVDMCCVMWHMCRKYIYFYWKLYCEGLRDGKVLFLLNFLQQIIQVNEKIEGNVVINLQLKSLWRSCMSNIS